MGINQSKDQFWSRVKTEYEKSDIFSHQPRPRKYLQNRTTTIISAVFKLRGCVNQIENKNPSGASEQDIVTIYYFLFTMFYKLTVHIINLFNILIIQLVEPSKNIISPRF